MQYMTVLLFEYGHSKINTWDRKWSGEGKVFAKEVFLTTKKREKLIALGFDLHRGAKKHLHTILETVGLRM